MILKSLEIHNFLIYKDEFIDCEGKDLIGILAEYVKNKKRSNRGGKSSIPEAIRYLLINRTRYKKNVDAIHYGMQEMFIQGIFEEDGKEYRIKRGINHKSDSVLELNWIDKTSDAEKEIRRLFGVSKDDFDLTLFFKQSDINGFMDLEPSEKSEKLMKWLDNEHWTAKEEAVKLNVKRLSEKVKENDTVIRTLETGLENISDVELALNVLKNKKDKLEESKMSLFKKCESLKKDLTIEEKNKSRVFGKYRLLKEANENLKNKLSKSDVFSKIEKVEINIAINKKKLKRLDEQLFVKSKNEKIILEKKISELGDYILKMSNTNNGLCPILKESCSLIKIDKKQLLGLKKELGIRKEKYAKLLETIRLNDPTIVKERINVLNGILVGLQKNVVNPKEIKKEIALNEKEISSCTISTNKIGKRIDNINEELLPIEEKLEKVTDDLNEANIEISNKENIIKRFNESSKKIKIIKKENELLRRDLEDERVLLVMFSKQGIPASEIENAFQDIEDTINYLLTDIEPSLSVGFSPDKELSKKAVSCNCGFIFPKGYRKNDCEKCGTQRTNQRKDEMSLKVYDNGVEAKFEGDSGGGKTLISFCVRVAISILKRTQNKCRLDIMFLDELDSSLDDHFAQSILNKISRTLMDKLKIKQVFMISHNPEIKSTVPHVLMVTRFKDYAKAKFL